MLQSRIEESTRSNHNFLELSLIDKIKAIFVHFVKNTDLLKYKIKEFEPSLTQKPKFSLSTKIITITKKQKIQKISQQLRTFLKKLK